MKSAFFNALLLGMGGFLGALLRHGLSGLVQRQVPMATFPHGTLSVNLLGCLLIGTFAGLADSRQLFSPDVRAFVLVGLLGSFTTFSTFGYETIALIREGELIHASGSVMAHVLLGLAAVWLGYAVAGSS